MPSAAQHEDQKAAVVESAQLLATPTRGKPGVLAAPLTPRAGFGDPATAVPYDDYVDLQTQLMEVLMENEEKEAQLTEMERVMAAHDHDLQTAVDGCYKARLFL